MNVPFLDLPVQYRQIENELRPVLEDIMRHGAFIGGPEVEAFEREFAAFCGSRHSVGLNSGTDALRFALMAIGLRPGDEVVTVANTFIATTEAITQAGGVPVFVDVDPSSANLDPARLPAAITPRTRAIVPVHLYGQTADMDPILEIADRHGLAVIEDACQAHGATYKGRAAGTMGAFGCFSFYPGKNLGAFGDAGAVVTDSDDGARLIRMLRDHGQSRKYYHDVEGYNGRLDAIQAAVLRLKLKHLDRWNQSRRAHADAYHRLLESIPGVDRILEAEGCRSVYHLYVILADDRDGLQRALTEKGIGTGLHYPLPLHLQNAYAHMGIRPGALPVTERMAQRLLSLPMFPELSPDQICYVADNVRLAMSEAPAAAASARG
jgi:dTDP-4-amino-4,6-dideoxygalactose transaminase